MRNERKNLRFVPQKFCEWKPYSDLNKGSTPPTDIMGNTITQSSTPLDSTNQTSMALESILYKH